jgi:ribosomal protein S30
MAVFSTVPGMDLFFSADIKNKKAGKTRPRLPRVEAQNRQTSTGRARSRKAWDVLLFRFVSW